MASNISRVRYKREKKEMPLPAFLPGIRGHADWHMREVKPGETPHTLNNLGSQGEYVIPMSDSHLDQVIKLHELLHAAHSPIEAPRDIINGHDIVKSEYLLIAEEFRINSYLRYLVNLDLPEWDDTLIDYTVALFDQFFTTHSPTDLMEALKWMFVIQPLWPHELAWSAELWNEAHFPTSVGTREDWMEIQSIFEGIYDKSVSVAVQNMLAQGDIFPWSNTIRLATALQEFKELMDNPNKVTGNPKALEDLDEDLQEAAREAMGHGLADEEEPAYKRARRRLHMPKIPEAQYAKEGPVVWGTMKIRKLFFTKSLPKNKLSRSKYRSSDEGAIPRYVHRLPIDGKIFGRKKRTNGGTVLIDDSGSMSWGLNDIKDIVEAAPASTIAAYSGSGTRGELVIIAENGKYADVNNADNRPVGGGNYVDMPALEWLAHQAKPRIWVSDAQTYPQSGHLYQAILDCLSFCQRHDINLVADAQDAHDVFMGKRELYR